jgi:hypothetical protein
LTGDTSETLGTGALVLRVTIRDFDELKKILRERFPNLTLIYHRMAPGPLRIINGKEV